MRTVRHKALMNILMKRYGNYAKVAMWLKGSKTWGDGTYSYTNRKKCKACGKYHKVNG